jgi:hypothetical protein
VTGQQLTIEEAIANRDGILHLIAGDPMKSASVRAVAETIARVATAGDRVSANSIRPHLPTWVNTAAIGPAFGHLQRAGALHRLGEVISTDEGTHGKRVALYLVTDDALEAIAS